MSKTTKPLQTRYTRPQRAGAWLTLAVFLTGPMPAAATETALGDVHRSLGEGEFTINEHDVTEFTQHSERVRLDWQVDIQQPVYHSLEFRQQVGDVVLNTSPGERATNFFGRVVCDATCIFANEAGITIHETAFIDVGAMIAVAGNIASEDFASGQLHFTGLSGSVYNYGTLQGDSIQLLGQNVANFGHVTTRGGQFMMLAGDEVWLRDHDSPIVIQSKLTAPEPGSDGSRFADTPAVENAGRIDAKGGHVRLAAGDMLSFAIRQSGEIEADSIELEGGDEGLVEVSGRLDASNETGAGGTIHVLGDYVSIQQGAEIDASGETGGGQIWIGGGPRGKADVRNARGTFVHEDASIRADAETDGDGGEIVVWADETAQVHGTISAQGGRRSGNGGFAETSGKHWLDVSRAPSLQARSGRSEDRGGHWLIDPNNIEIVAAGCGDAPQCLDEGLSPENRRNPNFDQNSIRPTVDDSKITADVIAVALEQGSNVTILTDTIAEVQGTQDGVITISAPIYVNDGAAQAGTEVTLALLAADDLIMNADIAVTAGKPGPDGDLTGLEPPEPGFIDLDVFLIAGDARQAQGPEVPGEPPQEFQGDLEVNATIWTGGGDVALGGVNVTIASDAEIDTDGGSLDVGGGPVSAATGLLLGAVGGDLRMRGQIDTSTTVLNGATGDPLPGGAVVLRAAAVKREAVSDADSPLVLAGGDLLIDGDVTTGGGAIVAEAIAGNLTLTSELDSGGGAVVLQSQQLEVDLVDGSGTISAGGRISVDESGLIKSGGNTVTLGTTDPIIGPTANEIILRGKIDSRVYDDAVLQDDEVGGAVALNTFVRTALNGEILGAGARVIVEGSDGTDPTIVTNGGRIESRGDGSFFLEDATLDARADASTAEELRDSVLVIDHAGPVDIGTDDGISRLLSDSVIEIAPSPLRFANAALGSPSPGFGESDVTISGDVTLQSDEIFILAGDGYGGLGTDARVNLQGNVWLQGQDGTSSPIRVTVLQDADLQSDDITSRLRDGVSNMERYELGASDGLLTIGTIDDGSATNTDELALVLNAKDDIVFENPLQDDKLASLDIQINEDFTITQAWADDINGAADNVSVTTGNRSFLDAADLTVEGVLEADEEVVLHAGSAGDGDLAFTSTAGIQAQQVVLWAGNGDGSGDATVDVSGLAAGAIDFVDPNPPPGQPAPSFELRQDAAIDDAVIPLATIFADGVAGVEYTLRSENGGITIGNETGAEDGVRGAEALLDTDLRLYAETDIVLDETITVQALDMGGLLNFRFTQDLYEAIRFTDLDTSKLTLRAGLRRGDGLGGILSFGVFDRGDDPNTPEIEVDTPIVAREIRLVAGDGVGGDGLDGGDSFVQLITDPGDLVWGQPNNDTPQFQGVGGQPFTFVFHQDGPIEQDILPSTTSSFGGVAPDFYGIRSDDGAITLDRFDPADTSLPPDDQLPRANDLLVLSGVSVDILRSDGESLDFDTDFDPVGGGNLTELQIRAISTGLRATSDQEQKTPEVLPGATLRLAGFDSQPSDDTRPSPLPPELDFGLVSDTAPAEIVLIQEADIDDANLIDLGQVAGGLNDYVLQSNRGGISVDPTQVDGAALTLTLFTGAFAFDEDLRNIVLEITGQDFVLQSLQAITPYQLVVGQAGMDLTIDASDFISLNGAFLNKTNDNLEVRGNTTLRAATINLTAGSADGNVDPTQDEWKPVVDVDPTVRFELDTPTSSTGRQLVLVQHGMWIDRALGPGEVIGDGLSYIPQADQIVNLDGLPTIDELQVWALRDSIEMPELTEADLQDRLPADRVGFFAGSNDVDDVHVELARADGSNEDLDLTTFQLVRFQAPEVTLRARGSGRVVARDPAILFSSIDRDPGADVDLAPLKLTIEQQDASFDESEGSSCSQDGGCLPDRTQLLLAGNLIDYTLRSENGTILVDNQLALRVDGTNLVLDGANAVFDIDSLRYDDLFLNSLQVGLANDPIQILLTDSESGSIDELRIFTVEDQVWHGDVTITGEVETFGNVVEFTGTIDAIDAVEKHSLLVAAGRQAIFEGDIGQAAGVLDKLAVHLNPASDLTNPASIRFGRDDAGPASETRVRATSIELWAVATPEATEPTSRSVQTSSIFKKNGDLTFQTHDFYISTGEKISVQGDLGIEIFDLPGGVAGRARIGDLSALDIWIGAAPGSTTPSIEIQRRPASTYIDRFGQLQNDTGVDFVANSITFDGDIRVTGLGGEPVFGLAQPIAAPLWMSPYSVLGAQVSGQPLTAASFDWSVSSLLPDLHPEGASRDDVSFMLFRDNLVPEPAARESIPWLPFNEEIVERLDIDLRSTSAREYASRLASAGIIDDVGTDLRAWDRRPIRVGEARVSGRTAARAHTLYREIFGRGNANAEQLRGTLQVVVDQYVRSTGARRVMGFELRRYVKNRPSSRYEAFKVLEDLDLLFALHRDLGLTPGEYRPIQHRWLEAIKPEGITTAQLAEAVRPSRYVRGSDVLDIFGD